MIKYLVICFSLLLSLEIQPQSKNETAAQIGKEKISLKEYKIRFELMPKLSEAVFNTDTLKNEFIYSLIAEKLWAMEAEVEGLDTIGYFKNTFGQLEKMFLKDALFRQEVESKIRISPQELEKGVNRSRNILKVQIWSGIDSVEVFNIYGLTKSGLSFDSLGVEELEISYGEMDDEKIEDLLYSMKPGEYSYPLKNKNGWFIFHVKNRIFNSKEDNEKVLSNVKSNLKERKAREIGIKFLAEFLKDIKAGADTAIFRNLSNKISEELQNKTPDEFEKQENTLFLSEASVLKIINSYSGNELSSEFININGKKTSLENFLNFMRLDILSAKSPDKLMVMQRLKSKIDSYIEQELLSEEAGRRKLNLSESYQEELKLWKDSYLAQMKRTNFLSKLNVSDDEVYEFYLDLSNRVDSVAQINILEILTSDLTVVETALNELEMGRDFRELAQLYTEREWTKSKGGEFGLFPVNLFKEISEVAINMNIGDVYGPLKLNEGYSIFKLIEKKEPVKAFTSDFDAVKEQLRNDLLLKKFQSLAEDETIKLAEKYQVRINSDAIQQLKVTNIQMFAYRYMGFGGKISAVPYTTPWHSWRKKIEVKNL